VLAERMLKDYPRIARWEEADDLFQQAAMRLHRCLADVAPSTPKDFLRLGALQIRRELRDMARHYFGPEGDAINQVRVPPNSNRSSVQTSQYDPSDSSSNPDKLAIWTEFHATVDGLPEVEKTVFDLLWYQELTQPEAAKILQMSVRQVRRYWQSARLKLQDRLDQTGAEW
jgi:RNA polymerase sigma factor (sigma-70 family)